MWMTSNSLVNMCRPAAMGSALAVAVLTVGCQATRSQHVAPDAPRLAQVIPEPRPPNEIRSNQVSTVELQSVVVRPLEPPLERLAGPEFLQTATEPLFIEVRTQDALGNLSGSSSPIIILNTRKLPNTWATGSNTLVAFLPDRSGIKATNTVAVMWVGRQATMTKKPLSFRAEDVGK